MFETVRFSPFLLVLLVAFWSTLVPPAMADTCSAQGKTCLFDDASGCAVSCPNGCTVQGAACTLGFGTDAVCKCIESAPLTGVERGEAAIDTSNDGLLPSAVAIAVIVALGLVVGARRRHRVSSAAH